MKIVQERFNILMSHIGVKLYDTNHAIDELRRWFPSVSFEQYKSILRHGLDTIKKQHNMEIGNYMLVSKSTGIRVPLEIRNDRYNGQIIGAIPTTLNPREVINIRHDLEVMTENVYDKRKLCEGFNYYIQHGIS